MASLRRRHSKSPMAYTMRGLAETQPTLSTSETVGRMSTSFRCSDFRDRLGTQALVMIGRWYPRQLLTNHK